MSYWNHRVVKTHYPKTDETFFTIHEAHYNDDGEIYTYTVSGVDPCGESIEELRDILNRMMSALDKPVLVDGEVVFAPLDDDEDDSDE